MPTGVYDRVKPNAGLFKRGEHRSPATEFKKGEHSIYGFSPNSPKLKKAIINRAYMYSDPSWLKAQRLSHLGQHSSPETEFKRGQHPSPSTEFKPLASGGVSSEEMLIRASGDYVNWRKAVFQRDDFTCQICGDRGGRLEAHHIKSFAEYPELRLELSNGVTHCKSCHRKGVMPNAEEDRFRCAL